MKNIAAIPERKISEEKLQERLKKGKICFGLKYQGELAAFTWCDPDQFNFRRNFFPLKNHEAYLFDAYTLIAFRGRKIAPYLRYQLYEELAKAGKKELLSISDGLNIPNKKFIPPQEIKF